MKEYRGVNSEMNFARQWERCSGRSCLRTLLLWEACAAITRLCPIQMSQ